MKKICMIGAFDTKGAEYAYLRKCILARGHEVLTVNTGVLGSTDLFAVDVEAEKVAEAGGASIEQLRADGDRGRAMKAMCAGSPAIVESLYEAGMIDGIIGMGGTGGTTVVTAAMRALPVGVPKVCVSTAASGDVSAYVGTRDVTMIPSIVDVAGINRISRIVFSRAAGAVCGMAETEISRSEQDKPVITASMFDAIKADLKEGIDVVEMNNNINDPEFSARAVEMMLDLIEQARRYTLEGGKFARAEP